MRAARSWAPVLTALLLGSAGAAEGGWDRGVRLFNAGIYDQAAVELARAVDASPGWWGAHYMLGWTYLKLGSPDAAEAHLSLADRLAPGEPSVAIRLAEVHLARERCARAADILDGINLAPVSSIVRAQVAELRARAFTEGARDNWRRARLQRAVSAAPDDARAHYAWGRAAYEAGDTLTAVAALARAAELDPADFEILDAYTRALLRQMRESRCDVRIAAARAAIPAATRLAQASPTHAHRGFLGAALLGAGDYQRAIEELTATAALDDTDWVPHFYLGQAYLKLDRWPEASDALHRALETADPVADKRVWKMLGFVYERQGRFDAALLAYRQANWAGGVSRAQRLLRERFGAE